MAYKWQNKKYPISEIASEFDNYTVVTQKNFLAVRKYILKGVLFATYSQIVQEKNLCVCIYMYIYLSMCVYTRGERVNDKTNVTNVLKNL